MKMLLYICFFIFGIIHCSAFNSLLNVDEISAVHYNINILSVPVLKDQVDGVETVKLVNKHGQEYVCAIPVIDISAADLKKSDESTGDLIDVAELLVPMEAAPCLVKRIHWWTYEFCYGSMIKQYHVEDNKVIGPILILGQYESEYNWKNGPESKNKLQNFHTQFYVNGSRCDINGKLRQTEVRFHCDDGASDYIRQVDEPQSCRYLLVIGTSRVCHHPYLQSQVTTSPYRLNCSPTVTTEQLQKYQEVQAVKKAKAEELKAKNPTENETHNGQQKSLPLESRAAFDEAISMATRRQSSLTKNKRLIFTKENKHQMETEELPFHKHPRSKLEALMGQGDFPSGHMTTSDFMRNSFRKVLETIKEEMENYRSELMKAYPAEEENPDEGDESSFFKNNMQNVKRRVDDLSNALTKEEYDEIYEDIKKLLDKSLGNMLALVKNYNHPMSDELGEELLERVSDIKQMVTEFLTVKEELRDVKLQEILNAIISTLALSEKHTQKVTEKLKTLEAVLKAKMEKLFNTDYSKTEKDHQKSLDSQLLDETIARGDSLPKAVVDDKTLLEKRKIQILKEEKMVESRKMKLEQRIKERLKKSGLDAAGQKIEVQIITPTYMSDDKYPTLVALSPKDEEILIRIVNSNEEEIEERERHASLVDSYNFQLEKELSTEEQPPPPEEDSQRQPKWPRAPSEVIRDEL